jgi:hypothetical protein
VCRISGQETYFEQKRSIHINHTNRLKRLFLSARSEHRVISNTVLFLYPCHSLPIIYLFSLPLSLKSSVVVNELHEKMLVAGENVRIKKMPLPLK